MNGHEGSTANPRACCGKHDPPAVCDGTNDPAYEALVEERDRLRDERDRAETALLMLARAGDGSYVAVLRQEDMAVKDTQDAIVERRRRAALASPEARKETP